MAAWEKAQLLDIHMPPAVETMLTEDRLVHALCIEGAAGTGRRRLAHALAGAVLCERQAGRMCGECLACRKVLAGVHSDVIEPDGGNGDYKKDAVRTLRGDIYRSPSEGRAKVIILNSAETITQEVQNLLLKVIEEPPPDTYFFLTCDNRYKLLSTVRSRAMVIALPPLSPVECLAAVRSSVTDKTEEQLRLAVLYSDGSPGLACEMLLDDVVMNRFQRAEEVLKALVGGGGYPLLKALVPAEKSRQEYTALLDAADRLLGASELRERLGINLQKAIKLKNILAGGMAKNETNGYLPLISAAMAEESRRK
ncbi:MAG: DNA polymerase III subunit [Angelakisella sp.]